MKTLEHVIPSVNSCAIDMMNVIMTKLYFFWKRREKIYNPTLFESISVMDLESGQESSIYTQYM